MLEDRDYMREPSRSWRWSATVLLVVALIAAYILQITLLSKEYTHRYLELSLGGLEQLSLWQLVTYQFLHGGWLHLLLNCWALYVFGREVEAALGKTQFLTLYFFSGIAGGLLHVLAVWIWPDYFNVNVSVVGASAGVFGVVSAYALLWPDRILTVLLFFVFPVHLRARSLLLINLVLTGVGIAAMFVPVLRPILSGNIAHMAHLGGILTGLAYIRSLEAARRNFWLWRPFAARQRKRELVKAASIRIPRWPAPKSENPVEIPEEEFISREVDPILDKISAHGIQSLTERERLILEAARNKMAKR